MLVKEDPSLGSGPICSARTLFSLSPREAVTSAPTLRSVVKDRQHGPVDQTCPEPERPSLNPNSLSYLLEYFRKVIHHFWAKGSPSVKWGIFSIFISKANDRFYFYGD